MAIVSQEFLVLLPLRQAFVSSPVVVGNLGFGLELVHLERYRGDVFIEERQPWEGPDFCPACPVWPLN